MTRNSYRTPLGRVRKLGASHSGTGEAYHQRLTAIALVPLTVGFVCVVLAELAKDYNGARADLGRPFPAIVMTLFVLAGVYHMEIGMRAVIRDYLQGHLREWALIVNTLFSIALGVACIYAIARIGFV